MVKIKQKKHPLENEYLIYNYGTQDYTGTSWALALYKLENGVMKDVYHPVDYVTEPSDIGERNIDDLLELMIKRKIKKVYSVWHLDDFFGIPAETISLHEKKTEPEIIELWAKWEQIEEDSYEHERLKEKGIEVIFYNETWQIK